MHKNKKGSQNAANRRKWVESQREATLESQRESEEKYRNMLESMQEGYFEVDLAGNFTFFNDSMARLYDYSKEELMGMNYRQFTDKENAKILFQTFTGVYNTGEPVKEAFWQVIIKDGSIKYVEGSASLIKDSSGKPTGFRGIVHDITKRKKAEELLRQSEVQYRLLADHMKDFVWIMDLNFNLRYISPSSEKITGYTWDEMKAIPADKFVEKMVTTTSFKAAIDFFSIEMSKALVAPSTYSMNCLLELEVICKGGRTLWLEHSYNIIRDENGKPLSILGVGREITGRKLAENALKKSEERYRSVFENAGLPIVIMENSLVIFMVNDRFVEMSGYGKDEIEGRMTFMDFLASGDHEDLMESFSRRKGDKPVEYECRIAHRNGEEFDVLIRLGHIPGAGQFIASFADITSRKKAEVALLESQEHLQKENIRLRSSIRERYRFCDIIGKSQAMQEVYEFILQAAATQANVIIYGESGTGKELVAKAIHETSDRSQKRFVTIHCGAVPETLMESELFGYKKGAFTGATIDKRGYLDEADGGTIFLDEVGEIGLNMQVKLLRAIAGDGYTPLGGNTINKSDVRIIAATNRNLRELVKQGVIRDDFFYRIHILPIYLPPLRERKDDLPLLVDHFLQLHGKKHPPLPAHIAEALLNYDWPGNIRELQSVLHRYLTLKRLDFAGGPTTMPVKPEGWVPKNRDDDIQVEEPTMNLKTMERDNIIRALSGHNWHRGRTALALGISRKTLFRKMQKFCLTPP